MAQHFLLSSKAKTLSLAQVFRFSDAEADAMFRQIRWDATNGAPVCPKCGGLDAYECRRPSGALRFRCKACKADFTITSGTLFDNHKLPLRMYLAAIAVFCNEVKGKSMVAMSRDLGLAYKSAFVLCHKMREAMAEEMKGRIIGDDHDEASVDGAYFGGQSYLTEGPSPHSVSNCEALMPRAASNTPTMKEFAGDPQHAFPGHGQLKPEQAEIARLKREVTKLKAERDILKKAAAYFAKEST